MPSGRVALSVYSAIERTPAADAFVRALDQNLGSDARIKRAEHIFSMADEVGALMASEGFEEITLHTVTKRITFPSVFDYVQFQLVATPMAGLLASRSAAERGSFIKVIASHTRSFLDAELLRDGRLSFPQEAHVAIASKAR